MNAKQYVTTGTYVAIGLFSAFAIQTATATQASASPQEHRNGSAVGNTQPTAPRAAAAMTSSQMQQAIKDSYDPTAYTTPSAYSQLAGYSSNSSSSYPSSSYSSYPSGSSSYPSNSYSSSSYSSYPSNSYSSYPSNSYSSSSYSSYPSNSYSSSSYSSYPSNSYSTYPSGSSSYSSPTYTSTPCQGSCYANAYPMSYSGSYTSGYYQQSPSSGLTKVITPLNTPSGPSTYCPSCTVTKTTVNYPNSPYSVSIYTTQNPNAKVNSDGFILPQPVKTYPTTKYNGKPIPVCNVSPSGKKTCS